MRMEELNKIDKALMLAPKVLILITGVPGIILTLLTLLGRIQGLPWIAIGPALTIAGILLLTVCLRNIPVTPPHVGLVIIWGKRKRKILKEGWHLLAPFFPFMYNAILVNVERKNYDLHPKNVRTKEKAELAMEISITFSPEREDPEILAEYITSGGEHKVINILDDLIEEKGREFTIKYSWQKCLAANEEIARTLITEVTGQDQPTDIQRIRKGDGVAKIESLGIVLNRLNIGTIWIKGKLGEEAEKIAQEQRERAAEKIELKHITARAKEMREELGISSKDAIEVVQTERYKVDKRIVEYKGLKGVKGLPLISVGGEGPPRAKKKKRGR